MRITANLPAAGSLAHAVCAYLQAHPREVLGVSAAARLSRADLATVPAALDGAVEVGLLVAHGRGAMAIYTAGPNLADTVLAGPPPGSLGMRVSGTDTPPPYTGHRLRGTRSRALVDLAAVPVHYSPPAPGDAPPLRQQHTAYDVLFDRLDQVGAWCELPMPMYAAAAKATQIYRKVHTARGVRFTVRKGDDADTFRIRRVS